MEKPKINGTSSLEYAKGRIDRFVIKMQEDLQEPIMLLFKSLGCTDKEIEDLDMHYPSSQGYYFIYCPDVRCHIIVDEKSATLIFDSNKKKEFLIQKIEKFFKVL